MAFLRCLRKVRLPYDDIVVTRISIRTVEVEKTSKMILSEPVGPGSGGGAV